MHLLLCQVFVFNLQELVFNSVLYKHAKNSRIDFSNRLPNSQNTIGYIHKRMLQCGQMAINCVERELPVMDTNFISKPEIRSLISCMCIFLCSNLENPS